MRQNGYLQKAALLFLSLLCLLSMALPAAYAFWSDAFLLSTDVARPAMEGQLSEEAQEIPIVYALYRKRILSGIEMNAAAEETDAVEQANSLAEILKELENAGVVPQVCRERADTIFHLPTAKAYRREENGFGETIYHGYTRYVGNARSQIQNVSVQQHEATGLVISCSISIHARPQEQAGALLRAYRSYLGLDSLHDWQMTETGESAACWSQTGQLYLSCAFQEDRFFISAFSLTQEELWPVASSFSR